MEDIKRIWGKTTHPKDKEQVSRSLTKRGQVWQRSTIMESCQHDQEVKCAKEQLVAIPEQLQNEKLKYETLEAEAKN